MSITLRLYGASAPLAHRLGRGDGKVMLIDSKRTLRRPESPPHAHTPSRPIAPIASAQYAADLIRNAPIFGATQRPNSNPHSAMPPLAFFHTSRGFLPRGLSDAYRRPQ